MNRAIVRTSDPARQPRVHATTAPATDSVLLKPTTCGLIETALEGASHAFHQTATAQEYVVAVLDADRNESVSSISGGDRGCAKALGAPADRDVCGTGFFAFSAACYRDCAVLWVSGGAV